MIERPAPIRLRFGVAAFLIALLMLVPTVCMASVCSAASSHDCCPKSRVLTSCPSDVLATAKLAEAVTPGPAAALMSTSLIILNPSIILSRSTWSRQSFLEVPADGIVGRARHLVLRI